METAEERSENDRGKECWDNISTVLCSAQVPADYSEANTLELLRLVHCVNSALDFSDASASALSVLLQRLVADHTGSLPADLSSLLGPALAPAPPAAVPGTGPADAKPPVDPATKRVCARPSPSPFPLPPVDPFECLH